MNQLYKKTFDHITMPEDRAQSLCTELIAHYAMNEKEVTPMNRTIARRSHTLLVAVILLLAMSASALACGIYYAVTYEVNEDAVISDDAVNLTDLDADFEYGDYTYHEEDGMVIVEMGETGTEDEVIYSLTDDLSEGESIEMTDQDLEFTIDSYHYTEQDGKITVDLSDRAAE